jgi:RNA polymerase sigma-70 factor (ECF subfamily)
MQSIWTDLGQRLRQFVGARISDAHAADDVTQDVLLKVQARLGDLPAEDKLPAWLFQIARNTIIDYHRARAVREHQDITHAESAVPLEAESDEEDAVRELTPCLGRMVEQLPEPYREAMKLADIQGISQQELADRTGVSLSGAKSRVQRARQQLRAMIDDCCRIERDTRGNVMDFERTSRSARYCGDADGNSQCGR